LLIKVMIQSVWIAQWNEMIEDPEQRIGRPRQLYVGEPKRDYAPVSKR
jgi:citrate synthase